MVDTLAFLKNDYTEEEIYKIIDEISTYVTFFGGYGATLFKTTSAAIYREKKEGFEVPEDFIVGKLSADMLAIQQKFDEKKDASPDERLEFMCSSECNELMEARGAIANSYLAEHDGFNVKEYEPNKYVINARLNMGAHRDLARLLKNMGIEYTDMVHWWNNEFDQNTAFEFIKYEPKEIEMNTYNFWLADIYTDDEIECMMSTFSKALKKTRYGIYHIQYGGIKRASYDTIVKVPLIDEYKMFMNFQSDLNSKLWENAMAEGEPDEKTWPKIRSVLEKEASAYCETHHIFEEKEIKKGQMVLPIHIVDEDADEVKRNLENAGYPLAFYSIDAPESIPEGAFERIGF